MILKDCKGTQSSVQGMRLAEAPQGKLCRLQASTVRCHGCTTALGPSAQQPTCWDPSCRVAAFMLCPCKGGRASR